MHGLESALLQDKPVEPTAASSEADKRLWETWERSNRLLLSFLKMSIAPSIKPSMPKTENVRKFMAEIKSFAKTDIVDKSVVATLINELSTKRHDISKSMNEHITHMVNIYNQLKGLEVELGERVLVEFILKSCQGREFEQFRMNYNQQKEKWTLPECKAMLIQEELRQREKVHKCYLCNKPGHKKAECLKRKAWMEKKGISDASTSNGK
nr:Retrovirus-related Pol polyprotein from transposon TNT 1-94 [Ipomoea batatas]